MNSILTPFDFTGTQTLSKRLFRKRVLPIDSISYDGRTIDFTHEYLDTMVKAFNDSAFDNIPLQFADADNRHTNDPERHRGDVVAMSLESDGLYVTVAATPEGAKVLESNPKLGISARIINDYDRADGKHYNAAMQHVLATPDPRIPGLGPWSSVDSFSNSSESDIIDLTAEKFAAKNIQKEKSVPAKKDTFTEDEITRLRDFLTELDADADDGTEAETTDAETSAEDNSELTDAELADLIASLDADTSTEEVKTPELSDAALSNPNADKALELANAQATELTRIRNELDESKWANERVALMRNLGLPPAVLDMAKPLLKGDGHILEFSNGDKVDAGKVMRDVLQEVGKLAKLLDLSNEIGSSVEADPDTSAEASAKRDETTKAVRAMMGN